MMDGMHTTAASAELDGRGLAIAAPGLVETFPAATPAPRSEAAKRAMDIVLTLLMLVPLAPVMAVVALAIRLGSGPQVLVRHERIGRDGIGP